MTFTQLLEVFDRVQIGEVHTAAQKDGLVAGDRVDFLYQAAAEIGSKLGIPRKRHTQQFATGTVNEVTLSGTPSGFLKPVGIISVNGMDVKPVRNYEELSMYRNQNSFNRYYLFDESHSVADLLQFDVAVANPLVSFECSTWTDWTTLALSDEPFGGMFERFHYIVAYRAAIKLWMSEEHFGTSRYYRSEYNEEVKALALAAGTPEAITELQFSMQGSGGQESDA